MISRNTINLFLVSTIASLMAQVSLATTQTETSTPVNQTIDISPLIFSDYAELQRISPHAKVFHDPTNDLRIEHILSLPEDAFGTAEKGSLSLSARQGTMWLRFSVHRDESSSIHNPWFMGHSGSFDVYDYSLFVDKELRASYKSEFSRPINKRHSPHRFPAFPIELSPGETGTIFVRAKTKINFTLAGWVGNHDSLTLRAAREQHFYGFFFGALALMFIYILAQWLHLRESANFYYMLFLAGVASVAFEMLSLAAWFPSLEPLCHTTVIPALRYLAITAALIFARYFLAFEIVFPKTAVVFKVLERGTIGLAFLSPFLGNSFLAISSDGLNGIAAILIISTAVRIRSQQPRPVMYFLLGWAAFLSGLILWTLSRKGILPQNFYLTHAVLFGQLIEVTMMSLGLGERLRVIEAKSILADRKTQENADLHQLVRILCHDISSPLTILRMTIDKEVKNSKKMDIADSREGKKWGRAQRATTVIMDIIESVRKIYGMQSGKLEMELESVPLGSLIENAEFLFADRLEEKQIKLVDSFGSSGADLSVLAEPVSLRNDVFNNLISNAIKFTKPGGKIEIRAQDTGEEVVLTVIDEGIGIPRVLLDQIFDVHAHTTRPGTDKEKGTGFGMPLVKSCLDQYGARIEIDSRPVEDFPSSHGTTIALTFRKPLAKLIFDEKKTG